MSDAEACQNCKNYGRHVGGLDDGADANPVRKRQQAQDVLLKTEIPITRIISNILLY